MLKNSLFYSCFLISLQIHNWDKCCHLVFGKAFVYKRQNTILQHIHGNIPYMFDRWADPVVHLLLLKSSMLPTYLPRLRTIKAALPLVWSEE